MKLASCALALALAVAMVAAAGGSSSGSDLTTLRVGIAWEPSSLNAIVDGYDATLLTDALTDPILQPLPDGGLEPLVAARVPSLANGDVRTVGGGMTVRLRLRRSAAWSDGVPITCRDVRQLWRIHVDRDVLVQSRVGWDLVHAVTCPEQKTAVLHFRERYADFLTLLRQPPLPSHDLRGRDFNTWWLDRMPVTNGPYRMVRWRRGSTVVLERDPAHWDRARRRPAIPRIEYRVLADPNVLNLQASGGEVQLVERQLEVPLDRERSMFPRQRLLLAPRPGFEQIGFSLAPGRPTANPNLRRALAHSIDRAEIVEMLLGGAPFSVHQSVLVPSHGGAFVEPWARYGPDPAAAARRFRAAGYTLRSGAWHAPDGSRLELTLKLASDTGYRSRLAQLLQQQLADAGVALRISVEEGAVFEEQTLERGTFDLAMWNVGIESPHELVRVLSCQEGRANFTGYCDPQVDRLLAAASRELDQAPRDQLLVRVQERIAAAVPVLPLYQQVAEVVHQPDVRGVVLNPSAGVAWNVHEWRMRA